MTDQEINAKIAELCGWTRCPCGGANCWNPPPAGGDMFPPNYAGSLDAMHEAVAGLEQYLRRKFIQTFWYERETQAGDDWDDRLAISEATARQRAEAFLRVHGAWKEGA